MPTFTLANDDMNRLLERARAEWHKDLNDNGVTVSCIVAIAKLDEEGNPMGDALKHHGVACFAVVRIVKQSDRVQGMADAEITLDGDRWAFLDDAERLAILDHELTHIEIVKEDGAVKLDDGGRPKLKLRAHDYEHGWFNETAKRHGPKSQEVQQAQQLFDADGQSYFGFVGSPSVPVAARRAAAKLAKQLKASNTTVAEAVAGAVRA